MCERNVNPRHQPLDFKRPASCPTVGGAFSPPRFPRPRPTPPAGKPPQGRPQLGRNRGISRKGWNPRRSVGQPHPPSPVREHLDRRRLPACPPAGCALPHGLQPGADRPKGEIRDRTTDGQHVRIAGLALRAAISICWNTKHPGPAVSRRCRAGFDCSPDRLAHISRPSDGHTSCSPARAGGRNSDPNPWRTIRHSPASDPYSTVTDFARLRG